MPYLDNNTLYIKSDATNDQIEKAVKDILKQVSKNLGRKILSKINANIIIDSKNHHYGYGYLRVSNTEFYHILCGRNPDGSERIHHIKNPEYHSVEEKKTSWADIMEEEDLTIIEIKDPPLFSVPEILLSESRRADIKADFLNQGIDKESPLSTTITFEPAYVNSLDGNFHPNILFFKGINEFITEEYLLKVFQQYSTIDKYPKIRLYGDSVEIIFNPKTHDAQFCLLMTKKLILSHKNNKYVFFPKYKYKKI